MPHRSHPTFRPVLEALETKQPLSAGAATAPLGQAKADSGVHAAGTVSPQVSHKPDFGYLVYRITNPNPFNSRFPPPPFGHVLVQSRQPAPGQVYNVLYIAVRNGTAQTFDASSGFQIKFPGQKNATPILTGNQQWKSGQEFIFYVLTKKYYPLPNQVTSGFEFQLGGARSVGIPGPSGIYLRLNYNPATFNRTLDTIVTLGQGSQGGSAFRFGLPDTAIYEFLSAKTRRTDFGGYF
jgi:hypothetical protein